MSKQITDVICMYPFCDEWLKTALVKAMEDLINNQTLSIPGSNLAFYYDGVEVTQHYPLNPGDKFKVSAIDRNGIKWQLESDNYCHRPRKST